MRVGTHPTRNCATLGPLGFSRRLLNLYSQSSLEPLLLGFQHLADVSRYTSSHDFAPTCVFNKQSLPLNYMLLFKNRILFDPFQAPLIPKLRGHFAEFLQSSYLMHLSTLIPNHLCRFKYGIKNMALSRDLKSQCKDTTFIMKKTNYSILKITL